MLIERAIDQYAPCTGSWLERWEGPDGGLIAAWSAGVELAIARHDLAAAATRGELCELPWKGGLRKALRGSKWGPLLYLAMWQGLRRQPLQIDTEAEVTLQCTATGGSVTFTADAAKWNIEG